MGIASQVRTAPDPVAASGEQVPCRICGGPRLREFLNLGDQPWCNDFVTREQVGLERRYPLRVYFCDRCTAIQVGHTIPKEVMFLDHRYLSGTTQTMRAHFAAVAAEADRLLQSEGLTLNDRLVADIGSNDGTLLSAFRSTGARLLGIEPCEKAARVAVAQGIPTIQKFLNEELARQIRRDHGAAQLISAANVFYHVEELHSIMRGITHLLAPDGIFVMQGSYLPRLIEHKAFDIIYHEHLLYYRLETIQHLLNPYGMEVFDVEEAPVHGGSVVVYIGYRGVRPVRPTVPRMIAWERAHGYHQFATYERFRREVEALRERIVRMVHEKVRAGFRVFCYGAPAKGTAMLNYCGLTVAEMPMAVEKNPLKVGRYIPGTGIPIVDEADAPEPDFYFLLAWNFLSEFLRSPTVLAGERRFIVPLPEPRVVP